MGGVDWLLLALITTHENGTVRKLSTVNQQVSTTRALSSVGNHTEVTCCASVSSLSNY